MTLFQPRASNPNRTPLFFGLAAGLTALPVLLVSYLPLVDYSGHLGRIQILQKYASNPALQQRYEVLHTALPNLMMDWVLYGLSWIVPMETASRGFVLLVTALFVAGVASLSRTLHGRLTGLAAVALLFQFNSMFLYGFVAYQSGVAMFLLTFSLWCRWRRDWSPLRLITLAALSVLTYFAHLAGFMFLGLAVASFLIIELTRTKRVPWKMLAGSGVLAGPIALYLSLGSRRGAPAETVWSTLIGKAKHSLVLLLGYDMKIDIAVMALLAAAAGLLLWTRPRLDRDMAILAGVFWAGFLLAPDVFMTGSDADARMVLPAAVCTLLALKPGALPLSRWALWLTAAAFVLRIGSIGLTWQRQNTALLEPEIALYAQIPENARVFPLFQWSSDAAENKFERPVYHFISWASVKRDAIVPTNFTIEGQHSVVERPGYWFETPSFDRPDAFAWDKISQNYDVVWFFGTDQTVLGQLETRWPRIAQSGKARLYRVR